MPTPILFDAVTLRHFGIAGRLDVLERRYAHHDLPRWSEAVADEIRAGQGQPDCNAVLAATWLGQPIAPSAAELAAVVSLQIGLNEGRRPPTKHLGEAETLYFAEHLGGIIVTDDNAAFDFSARRLGQGRVRDSIDVLREAVAMGEISASEAHTVVNAVRNSGRYLRHKHPSTLPSNYFE